MKQIRIFLPLTVLIIFTVAPEEKGTTSAAEPSIPAAQQPQPPPAAVVDLKASDGTVLKASYFAAAKRRPGMLLFHRNPAGRSG